MSHVRHFHFCENKLAASSDAYFFNGFVIAHNSFQWLYVSDREHDQSVTNIFEYRPFKMVLHYCEVDHDQRCRVWRHLERDFDPGGHHTFLLIGEFEKL